MKRWSRALAAFGIGYAIATTVGWVTFPRPALMWTLTFTLMPLVFASLAYWYFHGAKPSAGEATSEALRLTLLWIVLSFALDASVFVAVIPLAFGAKANWTFFVDQSPWIWLCYATLAPIVFGGLYAYQRRHIQLVPASGA
ncbi:hypothetical protein [Cognatiluteimonas telluris]|uniref:hypothetical protein n=1 Tax=Cognatiluteimonas telluris TaxID=1104775 RepID=UPI001408F18D|nr:hypothetical protein [Lysobacter telluris]